MPPGREALKTPPATEYADSPDSPEYLAERAFLDEAVTTMESDVLDDLQDLDGCSFNRKNGESAKENIERRWLEYQTGREALKNTPAKESEDSTDYPEYLAEQASLDEAVTTMESDVLDDHQDTDC